MKIKVLKTILMAAVCILALGGCTKKTEEQIQENAAVTATETTAETKAETAAETAAETQQSTEAAIEETAAPVAEYISAAEAPVLKDRPEEGDLIKGKTFFAQVPKNRYGGLCEEGDYAIGEFILWLNEVVLSDSGEILQRGKYAVPYIVSDGGNQENICLLSGGNDGEKPYGDDIWEFTTDENGSIVDAVLHSQAVSLKRNQEAGYFIEHDGKIYYRLPKAEAMNEFALFGNFMSGYCGPSEIRCYDPATGTSEKFFDSTGYGKMYVLEDNLVVLEEGNSGSDDLLMIPFDAGEATKVEGLNFRIMAIYDHYIIYRQDDYDKGEYTVSCIDIDNEATIELGKMETFENNPYPGELQQFYADGSNIWFTMADYEGTGHFYYSAKLYNADITKEGSLTARSIAEVADLPGSAAADYIAEKYNRAPGFIIRDDTQYMTSGEPATAEIDYAAGELGYYDSNGLRVSVNSGYETFESEEEDTTVTIELSEYTGNKIYLVRNESWRDRANDVGWREAYVRKHTYIVMVDPTTGEETIIDYAMNASVVS